MDCIVHGVAKSQARLSDFKKKKVLLRGGEGHCRLDLSLRSLKRRSSRYGCSFVLVLVQLL